MTKNRIGFGSDIVLINSKIGMGTTNPQSKLDVVGNVNISGSVTASNFIGTFAGTFEPNSIGLGTDTTGDYIKSISGTSNQIDVSGGTGEGSTPTISIASNPTLPGSVTITNDLQVNNNLNVAGNITIGGTAAYIVSNDFRIKDADIVIGYTTSINGLEVSNDTTANHGGIAVASTEGTPLVQIYNPSIGETNPATYKKIMWFKSGSFVGLNTDAWLINYAVGIGSTQFPSGTRLAAGSIQFTEKDLAVVRDINASGIVTANIFFGTLQGNSSTSDIATYATTSGIATYASTSGIATYATSSGIALSVSGGTASVTALNVFGTATVTDKLVLGLSTASLTGTNLQPLQIGSATSVQGAYISGFVGIGTTLPSSNLDIVGNVKVTGVITASSASSSIFGYRNIAISTADPSGGTDGDIWIKYIV